MSSDKRNKPVLWGQGALGDLWFQQPVIEEALRLAQMQERAPKRVPKKRPTLETDPSLDEWFD